MSGWNTYAEMRREYPAKGDSNAMVDGVFCDPAAAGIILEQDAEIERLRKRERNLFEMLQRCERDVQRAFRLDKEQDSERLGRHPFEAACHRIRQRAAGIAPIDELEEDA